MTHLDVLKSIVETDPWEIAHRLWSCSSCPKLDECKVASRPFQNDKFGCTPTKICRDCIEDWLKEEV